MNIAKQAYTRLWRGTLVVASLALLAYVLYFHQLGTLLPGYSKAEIATRVASADWHLILHDPINAPYKAFVWLGTAVLHQGMITTRIVAACFGTLAVLLFYLLARLRYNFWIACLGTILFGTSAGFLHAARLGTPVVLQFALLSFIWCILWYRARPRHRVLIGYVTIPLFAALWYVPGMIWFELFSILLFHRSVRRQLYAHKMVHLITWSLMFLAIIAPLILAIVRNPKLGLVAAGLPQTIEALSQIPSNLLNTIMAVGVRSDGNPLLWVGHAPLLNVIELTLLAIGIYTYIRRVRTASGSLRSIFLLGIALLAILLVSLGASVTFVYLVPLVYIFIVSGLHYLIGQWLTVFPRNPIARITGMVIICIMLGFSVLYQVQSYFVAWPHNLETRQTFRYLPNQ